MAPRPNRFRVCISSLILMLSLFGCSSSYFVTDEIAPSNVPSRQANEWFSGRTIAVTFPNDSTTYATDFTLIADSACWRNYYTNEFQSCPISQLQHVSYRDHTTGFFEGIGMGLGLTLLIRVLPLASDTQDHKTIRFDEQIQMLALATSIPFSIMNAMIGHRRDFYISKCGR
jgi:hypothetical protein